jgi:hypothetical protein
MEQIRWFTKPFWDLELALLDVTPAEVEAAGFNLVDPDSGVHGDEAGPVQEMVARLPSGVEVALIQHLGSPDIGLRLRASADTDLATVVREVLDALGLPTSRATWLRTEWPSPYERRAISDSN